MYAWILLAVLVLAIAVVLHALRPRDNFLRLPRPARGRRHLTISER